MESTTNEISRLLIDGIAYASVYGSGYMELTKHHAHFHISIRKVGDSTVPCALEDIVEQITDAMVHAKEFHVVTTHLSVAGGRYEVTIQNVCSGFRAQHVRTAAHIEACEVRCW